MPRVCTVRVPPSLVRGRVRRLVELPGGILQVQVWTGTIWAAEPGTLITPTEMERGVDAPIRILRALGIPESDWPAPPSGPARPPVSLLALWPALEWVVLPSIVGRILAG